MSGKTGMATTAVIKPFEHETSASRRSVRPILFIVMAYFWITLSPLPDMSELTSDAGWGTSSSALNQVIVLLMAGGILASLAATKAWKLVFQQRLLLALILVWFTATALLGNDPSAGFRRMMFVVIVCFCANAFLLVPRSQADFTFTLACIVSIVVGLSYIGVIALPVRAIHQATDGLEASLAGSWRGIYSHKNITAAAMAMAVFIGLYIASTGSKRLGWALAVGALLFVLFSGGKTSTIMVPFTLVVAWAFERFRKIRGLMVWGILIVANTILLGSALSPSVADTLTSLGVDATFTDRSSIWRLSIDAIEQRPLLGYGFQSFWQTQALFDSDAALETWAVTAANAHNAYVEAMVNAGVPGLILTLVWMVYSPLRNATAALESENDIRLTRLFLRIWLFGLFLSCLESAFYVNTGPVWFTILLSVFGLGLQARSKLAKGDGSAVAGKHSRRS